MQERSIGEPWRDELVAGLHALREGEFARAESHFARAYRAAPQRPEVCFALGRERLRRGLTDDAAALLAAAWSADRSLLSAGATLARCLGLHLERPADAHAVLDEAEALHGDSAVIDVTRAELFVQEGCFERAQARAERAHAASEGDGGEATRVAARAVLARVENSRGLALVEAGDYESALFSFKRAADRDPKWSAPHVNSGAAFSELGRPGPARTAYERAIAADPANALAHYNLGLLDLKAGRRGDALSRLERAAELEPDDTAIASAAEAARDGRGPDTGPRGSRPGGHT